MPTTTTTTVAKYFLLTNDTNDVKELNELLKKRIPSLKIINYDSDIHNEFITDLNAAESPLLLVDLDIESHFFLKIIDTLNKKKVRVIFISSHNELTLKVGDYLVIGFFVRPFSITKLVFFIFKSLEGIAQYSKKNEVQVVSKNKDVSIISVTDGKGIHILKLSRIMYCESNGNYTAVTQSGKKEIVFSKNLKVFEDNLSPFGFLRIHRSFIVNLNYANVLLTKQGDCLIMEDGKSISISKKVKKELYERLNVV